MANQYHYKYSSLTIIEKFLIGLSFPDKNGCILWIKSKNGKGYGQIKDYLNKPRNTYAHRFSYQLFYGSFDPKLHVLHKCDNPSCVNPMHLFLGYPKDNVHDCIKKGRAKHSHPRFGQANPSSKLTNNDIHQIRDLLKKEYRVIDIARIFCVNRHAISEIKNNRRWTHIKEEIINE